MIDVRILRKENRESESYQQTFVYEGDPHITVEHLLIRLNEKILTQSKERPITGECSCEQGICGACGMVINGRPALACQTYCDELLEKESLITISPLSKFPVICDLKVDRSGLYALMKQMNLWLKEKAVTDEKTYPLRYEASNCLMCGCCLEVCPNYSAGGVFSGMMGTAAITNLTLQSSKNTFREQYKKSVFEGCSKSLACQKICPLNIPMLEMMSDMNRVSIWKIWNIWKNTIE